MRLLFFCLVLGLGSLQLSAAKALPALPEASLEMPALLVDFSITSIEIDEPLGTRCCTRRGGGNSVRVCRADGDRALACRQAEIGLEKIE